MMPMSISRRKLLSIFSAAPLVAAIPVLVNSAPKQPGGDGDVAQDLTFDDITNLDGPPHFREWINKRTVSVRRP